MYMILINEREGKREEEGKEGVRGCDTEWRGDEWEEIVSKRQIRKEEEEVVEERQIR